MCLLLHTSTKSEVERRSSPPYVLKYMLDMVLVCRAVPEIFETFAENRQIREDKLEELAVANMIRGSMGTWLPLFIPPVLLM